MTVQKHPEPNSQQKNTRPDTNQASQAQAKEEFGGPKGLEPTRYGDWEQNGRCTDF